MEIAPITGVRAPSLLQVKRSENSQSPVFEIAPSARTGDETYSSSHQTPDRGLEEEDSGVVEEDETEQEAPPPPDGTGAKINCFA